MKDSETSEGVARELLQEINSRRQESVNLKREINGIPEDVRVFVREELTHIGYVLHEKHKLSIPAIRQLIFEMISVSI